MRCLTDPLWTIDATLKAKGFVLVRPPAVYHGPISVHGRTVTVEIDIPDVTFVKMPELRLIDRSNLRLDEIAHLHTDQGICYLGEGGLPLDLYDPGGSVLRVLKEGEAALERSFGGAVTQEYESELASYWRGDNVFVALGFSQTSRIGQAEIIDIGMETRRRFVVVAKGAWQHLKPRFRGTVSVLWFSETLRHTPKFHAHNLAGICDWLAVQPVLPQGWREAIIAAAAAGLPIFLVAPNAIIGWEPIFPSSLEALRISPRISNQFFAKKVAKSLEKVELRRMTGVELDLRFVVERNLGGTPSLIGKKIALIGVGTIGSNLAKLLVQCGAGCEADLIIYDTDLLRPGNLGRHLLGFQNLNQPKAVAVAAALKQFHPDVQIAPVPQDATKNKDALARADLIVDATGDYNTSIALNDWWVKMPKSEHPSGLIHSWVFGNGVAVQSFLNLKDEYACYRCLKPSFGEPWRYSPLKDRKQELTLAAARCGEAGYVPFATDAPIAAAGLTLRAILDWASGKPGQRLRTTTLDYEQGNFVRWASPFPDDDCPACRG